MADAAPIPAELATVSAPTKRRPDNTAKNSKLPLLIASLRTRAEAGARQLMRLLRQVTD